MKKRRIEIKVGLAIVWLACFLLAIAYWRLIGIGIQSIASGLVIVGIFASTTFLSRGMWKEKRATIWRWCVIFCVVALFMTGAGILVVSGLEVDQTQITAENVMAEYMGSRGSYVKNTKGVIRINDTYFRSEIWKIEEGEEEWQITLLLVKITGEDIGDVREILLPISKKELSGFEKEKAGKPTQGSTSQHDGGPDLFSNKKQRSGLC